MTHKIAIIGAGPAGLLCALDSHLANLDVTLIGPPSATCHAMVLAIHPKHLQHLRSLGLSLDATLVENMALDVYQNNITLSTKYQQQEALCYIIRYDQLLRELTKQINKLDIKWLQATASVLSSNTITVNGETHHYDSLAVCDGAHSKTRKALGVSSKLHHYQQTALIGLVSHTHPLRFAYQKFRDTGTLALLPTQNAHQSALIWSIDNQSLPLIETLGLKNQLQKQTSKVGKVLAIDHQHQIPLMAIQADHYFYESAFFIGSSLHHIHPLAGIGFNLTIRDIQCFIKTQTLKQGGSFYRNQRTHAHHKAHLLTHSLANQRKMGMKIANLSILPKALQSHWSQKILLNQVDDICLG